MLYLYRRAVGSSLPLNSGSDVVSRNGNDVETSNRSRKEKRRLEAQRREERQRKAGSWLKKLAEAEKKVEDLETEKIELEALMADPDLYQDQEAWSKTSSEYDECSRRLDRWLERWEEAQAKIDQIDAELGSN